MKRTKLYEIPYFRKKHREANYKDPMVSFKPYNNSSKRKNIRHGFRRIRLGTVSYEYLNPIVINGEERIKGAVTLEKLIEGMKKNNCYSP